jgi:hypothetical protein
MDVKFDGEPVIRFSDLATHNHGSTLPNTPPWNEIAGLDLGAGNCIQILADIKIKIHPYSQQKKNCKQGTQQSDHIVQNNFFSSSGRTGAIPSFPSYAEGDAPCLCLNDGKKRSTQHGKKSRKQIKRAAAQRKAAKAGNSGPCTQTYGAARDAEIQHTAESLPKLASSPEALKCLKAIADVYFKHASGETDPAKLDALTCNVPKTGK